jgi:hypothetical protein
METVAALIGALIVLTVSLAIAAVRAVFRPRAVTPNG